MTVLILIKSSNCYEILFKHYSANGLNLTNSFHRKTEGGSGKIQRDLFVSKRGRYQRLQNRVDRLQGRQLYRRGEPKLKHPKIIKPLQIEFQLAGERGQREARLGRNPLEKRNTLRPGKYLHLFRRGQIRGPMGEQHAAR